MCIFLKILMFLPLLKGSPQSANLCTNNSNITDDKTYNFSSFDGVLDINLICHHTFPQVIVSKPIERYCNEEFILSLPFLNGLGLSVAREKKHRTRPSDDASYRDAVDLNLSNLTDDIGDPYVDEGEDFPDNTNKSISSGFGSSYPPISAPRILASLEASPRTNASEEQQGGLLPGDANYTHLLTMAINNCVYRNLTGPDYLLLWYTAVDIVDQEISENMLNRTASIHSLVNKANLEELCTNNNFGLFIYLYPHPPKNVLVKLVPLVQLNYFEWISNLGLCDKVLALNFYKVRLDADTTTDPSTATSQDVPFSDIPVVESGGMRFGCCRGGFKELGVVVLISFALKQLFI